MMPRPRNENGLALVAVLIALSVMLSLLGPFLLSMGQADQVAYQDLNGAEARFVAEGGRDVALQRVARTQGTQDETPGFDSVEEFPSRFRLDQEETPLASARRVVSGEVEDLQGRIHAPTAPMIVWANLLRLSSYLADDLKPKDEDVVPCSGIDRFPDSGWIWIGNELIAYEKKTERGFESLTRAVNWPGSGSPPDPYGGPGGHRKGAMIWDARVRLLATAQFDEGHQDRSRFVAWGSLAELPRVSRFERGELTMRDVEPLRPLLTFDAARPQGSSLGKAERIMSRLDPGMTHRIEVRDGASFPSGAIVRIRTPDASEWALVVDHRPNGPRTSTIDGNRWFLYLHRVTQLEAEEGEAIIEPLQPVPVNANTASGDVLAALFAGTRQYAGAAATRGHFNLRTPFSRSKSKELAAKIIAARGDPDEETSQPFTGFEDFFTRAIQPMIDEEGTLSKNQLEYLFAGMVNGRQVKLDQATIPLVFESSGLVRYRICGAVQSGAKSTLSMRELRGIAYPQPARVVDRIYASQIDFDEATRLDRSRNFFHTWPQNTTMRVGRAAGEPPDLSVPPMLPYYHGKAAQWPTQNPEEGRATLAIARAPRWANGTAPHDFETSIDPEGHDVNEQGPYQNIQAHLPGAASTGQGRQQQQSSMRRSRAIPMYEGDHGFGIAFGLSAWYKPASLANQILFDLPSQQGTPIQNRIFLAIENNEIVLRMFDIAGLDPNPDVLNPQETCTKWTVPLAGNGIAADLWTHVAFEICGGTADGLVVFTDGAAKGRPWYVSHMQNGLPEFDPSMQNVPPGQGNRARHPTIGLENGDGWPQQNVAIVGGELIEFTGNQSGALITQRLDSRGGRFARQGAFEYARGGSGGGSAQIRIPAHAANSGIRLYGYSNPVLENYVVIPGQGSLSDSLQPWGAARVVNGNKPIELGQGTAGTGIDENHTGKIELAMPVPNAQSSAQGIPGFDKNGGYAALFQVHWQVTQPIPDQLGGCEIVRYSGFDGQSISIDQRAVQLPPDLNARGPTEWLAQTPRKFVTDWARWSNVDPNTLPQMFCFCVPISLAVQGLTLFDPANKDHSEWIQIYSPGQESMTEWVRYDHVDSGNNWVCRTRKSVIHSMYWNLTERAGVGQPRVVQRGNRFEIVFPTLPNQPMAYIQPPQINNTEIGHPDPFESGQNLPHYEARLRLGFRGDPSTGTSTHVQGGNAIVTHVFRTALVQGNVTLGRPGRGDRVALVTAAGGTSNPAVDWQTVNWCSRNWENPPTGNTGGGTGGGNTGGGTGGRRNQGMARDTKGPRCNLVALKAGPTVPLAGARLAPDTRLLDRIVKFPSGELPIQLTQPVVGGSSVDTLGNFSGKIDDIQGYWSLHHNQRSGGRNDEIVGTIAQPVADADQAFTVGVSRRIVQGTNMLQGGGLLLVEGEIIGFTQFDAGTGTVTVATNGRGMLGTEARGHDRGARVQFLSSRPATFLTSNVPATQSGLMVARPDKLPQGSGTVLCNQELMHYTWTRGPLLEMPQHSVANQGLFRGRYGTTPAQHDSNTLAISWPIRFWDRYELRGDDPELAYLGISTEAPDLYVTEVAWEEQLPETSMDIVLLARADERVPWSADPETTFGLWRFDDPRDAKGKLGRKIGAQASRWDFRFCVRYLAGAFNPQLFNATGWKRTPVVRNFLYSYQGSSQILAEEVTLR